MPGEVPRIGVGAWLGWSWARTKRWAAMSCAVRRTVERRAERASSGAGKSRHNFPTYEAGHEVSSGAPRELAEDVQAWLAETGASAPR